MKIKFKLLATFVPILFIGMTTTGYWSYLTAYESVREKEYQLLTQTLSLTFMELVNERHFLLVNSGLENVPVFRDAYQKEVFDELKLLHRSTGKHYTVTNASSHEILFSTQETWSRPPTDNASIVSVNSYKVAFGEAELNGEKVLFACTSFAPWNWKLTISQPTNALERSLVKITWTALIVTLLSLILVSFLLGRVIHHFVLKPVSKIKQATGHIAEEKSQVSISVREHDELGELARDVEVMSADIADYVTKAQSANKAKTDFLAVMSHEIRTPLNGIQGLATLLLETPLDEKQKQYATDLKTSAGILAQVINDVLDLSKIESGRTEMDLTEFNPDDMLRDLVTLLGTNASANNTRLEYRSRDLDNVVITSDITKLRQIVINLTSNAIKFTREGTVTVSAKLKGRETENPQLVVTVKDTGIGIAPERLQHIFEKFMQSDTSISRRYGGTGLGLSIAKELAQLLGGDINVVSREGEGSCFTVNVQVKVRSADEQQQEQLQKFDASEAQLSSGLRVLLAEDNAINAVVAQALLEQLGCHVDTAENGLEASIKVESNAYDAVFMDIHMPVMDGVEATQRIRAAKNNSASVPIIGLTAEAFTERHQVFIQAGMNDVVTKPVTLEALRKSLLVTLH